MWAMIENNLTPINSLPKEGDILYLKQMIEGGYGNVEKIKVLERLDGSLSHFAYNFMYIRTGDFNYITFKFDDGTYNDNILKEN